MLQSTRTVSFKVGGSPQGPLPLCSESSELFENSHGPSCRHKCGCKTFAGTNEYQVQLRTTASWHRRETFG